jgi:Flp pilus assembly protein TadD
MVLLAEGSLDRAESHLREALRLNPQDQIAREALEEIGKSRGRNKN